MNETPLATAITEAIAYRNRNIAGSADNGVAVNAETMRQIADAHHEHGTDDELSRDISRCLDRWRGPRGTDHEAISLADSALSRYVAGRRLDEGARVPRPQMQPPDRRVH